jgi:hypothetical protein
VLSLILGPSKDASISLDGQIRVRLFPLDNHGAHGRPFFALAGRTKLFAPADIDRIHEAMRPPSNMRLPSNSFHREGRSPN